MKSYYRKNDYKNNIEKAKSRLQSEISNILKEMTRDYASGQDIDLNKYKNASKAKCAEVICAFLNTIFTTDSFFGQIENEDGQIDKEGAKFRVEWDSSSEKFLPKHSGKKERSWNKLKGNLLDLKAKIVQNNIDNLSEAEKQITDKLDEISENFNTMIDDYFNDLKSNKTLNENVKEGDNIDILAHELSKETSEYYSNKAISDFLGIALIICTVSLAILSGAGVISLTSAAIVAGSAFI